MMESTDFTHSVSYQKELILKLQELLKKEIEGKAHSDRIEELASAIESATEALNNLTQYFSCPAKFIPHLMLRIRCGMNFAQGIIKLLYSVSRNEVHIIFSLFRFPSSDFPLPISLFPAPCSLLPAPCSLKTRNLYLTSRRIAIIYVLINKAVREAWPKALNAGQVSHLLIKNTTYCIVRRAEGHPGDETLEEWSLNHKVLTLLCIAD
ncbi:hypothetical protein BJP34_04720 [Moorena producens PAL-8-15-08-1]|uniref:Uncharacterized protein n=1 Tax=Moorena producens PAL-8-15-08-1 TaxID=1458985 RepID=A0A1D8TMH3_9CYAN|nr:hypothetical protein [Moorena producens]AOW98847.1 hypothetical protein BJP34_04720 [Moorena producens PAL-8-15-08-1]